ncbi:MAG: diguanylate cyclase [Methylophaga sp.]|nr:diguanylate cyclase [Methylophaga sp.]
MFYGKYNFTSLALIILLFISPASFAANSKETPIKLMTEIFPPFQYKHKNEVIGVSSDIVNAIQEELKIDNEIEIHLWSEAKEIVDHNQNTALFSMLRTAEREHKYKWVGPLSTMKLVFFKKKGSEITLNNIDDAKKVRAVGVTKGVANFEMLSNQGFTNLDVLTDSEDEENIRKLVDGEIDLWPTLLMAGLYNSRLQGLSGEIEPIKDVVAFSGDLYIAFNIQTDDAIIQKWQNAFDKLKEDKVIEDITRRYASEKTDFSLFVKLLIGVLFIIAIVIYHNRKLSRVNKKLNELQGQLQEQADRDHLTQLYNRRYFDHAASIVVKLGKRNKQQTGIILIDIDDFKLVNDTYGHHTGDDVIKHLSSCLLQHVRESDIVARIGGEEFVILLPNTSIEGSLNIASKIRAFVANSIVNINEDNTLKLTISLGVDEVLTDDKGITPSLNRADKALYKAKGSGKNKVETISKQ